MNAFRYIRSLALVVVVGFFIYQVTTRSDADLLNEAGLLPLRVELIQGNREEGNQPMLLEFWATWCGPCRDSIPHLNKLHGQFSRQGLQVVGISNEDPDTLRRFLEQTPIDYTVARDGNSTYFRHLGVTGIPHAVLLDRTGRIAWQGHPTSLQERRILNVLN